jgi:hypothetical protein
MLHLHGRILIGFVVSLVAVATVPRDAHTQGRRIVSGKVGADYGGRDPVTCPDRSAPRRGPITAALAARYVACQAEAISADGRLRLVDSLNVQVGRPRPFLITTDRRDDIDPSQPVYPIRGSFIEYACIATRWNTGGHSMYAGKNCSVTRSPEARGICWKTTFADWRCDLRDRVNELKVVRDSAPPPG